MGTRKQKKRQLHKVGFFIITALLLVSYQNCADATKLRMNKLSVNGSPTPSPSPSVTPPPGFAPTLTPDCMTNSNYNACIFYKNPIAQRGLAFNPAITYSTDLSSFQIYAVNIHGMTNPNSLSNASFNVTIGGGLTRATPNAQGNWKFAYAGDANHRVAQVMAYYWLNQQVDFMVQRVGNFFASGRALTVNSFETVDTDAQNNAYWSYSDRAIVLGYFNRAGTTEAAISAEIGAHELGHANRSFANTSANQILTATHQLCGNNLCCNSAAGCKAAIDEGQADYHAAMLFAPSTAIGEAVTNSLSGMATCGLSRNLNSNSSVTASGAYNSCGASANGEVHAMGIVYAAAWWDVRKEPTSVPAEVDRLFNEHLVVISDTDTFRTVLTKILSLDQSLFAGKYSTLINQKFAAHGITPN